MGAPKDFIDDLEAYSPSRVFRNNFIGDECLMTCLFHRGSSSSASRLFLVAIWCSKHMRK
ncbi:hypothetical protein Hanom_Chr06g00496891 [Helianthus anomalus]